MGRGNGEKSLIERAPSRAASAVAQPAGRLIEPRQFITSPDAARAAAAGNAQAQFGLLYATNDDGTINLPMEDFARRAEHAEALGGADLIPESRAALERDDEGNSVSVGEYFIGTQEEMLFNLMRNHLAIGGRAVAFRGPPGTGKDTFLREFAAIRRAPLLTFNIGPNTSIEDMLGGDGIKAQQFYDKEGNLINVASASTQIEGPLARALRHDCVAVIQEPEGMENELVRLHSVAGDNIGEPDKRVLVINSSAGDITLPVHPECIVAFTYNSGEEDVRFKPALHDRMLNYDFEYPDEEEESRRYAQMVTRAMNYEGVKTEAPKLMREYTPEEVLPVVRVMRAARDAHANSPTTFVTVPGARLGVSAFTNLALQAARGDEDPVATMATTFRYLLPGSENMSIQDRDNNIRDTLLSDLQEDLTNLAAKLAEEAAGKKPKKTAKKKAAKKKAAARK